MTLRRLLPLITLALAGCGSILEPGPLNEAVLGNWVRARRVRHTAAVFRQP